MLNACDIASHDPRYWVPPLWDAATHRRGDLSGPADYWYVGAAGRPKNSSSVCQPPS